MWPWRRRVEVVLASSAGDDATAALTMILRYHRKPVTFDEVRQAIYEAGASVANAWHVVTAAERFRTRARGLGLDDPRQLASLPTPSIAHVMWDRGRFPRPRDQGLDGYFAVLAATSPHRVRWIDPYAGQKDDAPAEFLEVASGTFLVFGEPSALPRARLRPDTSDG
jgi:ABC-type bacteriocin/lantibiotic exporter with double-glycine peptidase domain